MLDVPELILNGRMGDLSLVDIGANLTHASFRDDLTSVLQRAHVAGVQQIVVTGSSAESSAGAVDLCDRHEDLFATVGIHPHHAENYGDRAERALRDLMQHRAVVAVGETGLDYYRNYSTPGAQRKAFEAQLWIAVEEGLPVFVHQRQAHSDVIALLRAVRDRLAGAVVHCFTDDRDALMEYLDLGCHIGLTGWICDRRRGQHLLELAALIPAGRLMVETDAPFLLPKSLEPRPRSNRNEPAYLTEVLRTLAHARGESIAHTAAHTSATARAFFALPNPE